MKNLLFNLLLVLSIIVSSCDNQEIRGVGELVTQELYLTSFDKIDFKVPGEVRIIQGAEQSVTVTGQANIISHLNTDVRGNQWEIEFNKNRMSYTFLEIVIVVPTVSEIQLKGSGNLLLEEFTDIGNISFKVEGSGDIKIEALEGPEHVQINIEGSGDIEVINPSAPITSLTIDLSGSGSFYGFALPSKQCDIKTAGSGDVEVKVNDSLKAQMLGSSNVYYKGQPQLEVNITGSGRIISAN